LATPGEVASPRLINDLERQTSRSARFDPIALFRALSNNHQSPSAITVLLIACCALDAIGALAMLGALR